MKPISGSDDGFRQLIVDKKLLFRKRILASQGLADKIYHVIYSNFYCTEPPQDSLESIFETAQRMARIYTYGGGVGADIYGLAPAGSKVRNATKESTGAVSFMNLYSMVTELISQRGRCGGTHDLHVLRAPGHRGFHTRTRKRG